MTDIEKALSSNIIPWNNIEYKTNSFWIFDNINTKIFTPVSKSMSDLLSCYKAAYTMGVVGIQNEKYISFTINQIVNNNNEYPFIELIPKYHD